MWKMRWHRLPLIEGKVNPVQAEWKAPRYRRVYNMTFL
jgi:hypothetical protein